VLHFFRRSEPALALLLGLYILVLRLPALMGWIQVDAPEPEGGGVLYALLPQVLRTPGVASAWVSAVLVVVQAVAVNRLVDHLRMLPDRNWFPGVFYGLVASCTADLHFLSPALLAATLIPVLFPMLTGLYNKLEVTKPSFDLGFGVAAGSLIYPSFFWMIIAVLMSIRIWRSYALRERIVLLTGVVVAYFLAFTGFFWFDKGNWFWETQLSGWRNGWGVFLPSPVDQWAGKGLLMFLLLFVALNIQAFYKKRLIQEQKFVGTLLWFWAMAVLIFVAKPVWPQAHWALAAFPMAVLTALRFQEIRNFALAEAMHMLMLILLYISLFSEHLIPLLK
jgi:hypothetical protein